MDQGQREWCGQIGRSNKSAIKTGRNNMQDVSASTPQFQLLLDQLRRRCAIASSSTVEFLLLLLVAIKTKLGVTETQPRPQPSPHHIALPQATVLSVREFVACAAPPSFLYP